MVPLGVEILNCSDALDVQVLTSHMDHTQDASILVWWVAYHGLNYVSFQPISSQSLKENILFEEVFTNQVTLLEHLGDQWPFPVIECIL